ncbi:MAG: single-stranded DNA-binding protein [Chitinophagaceae bacterium]
MIIIGRLTRDAVVNQLKDEREVVNFSIAVNDFYKPKGSDGKQFTTFYNCSYWINSKLANYLKKGCLVEVSGRVYVTRLFQLRKAHIVKCRYCNSTKFLE